MTHDDSNETSQSMPGRAALLFGVDGWIASGFGSGLAPKAPGTVGSAVAIVPWLALRGLPWWAYLAVVLGAFALGVWAASRVIHRIGVEDPGVIVWDEFVGIWLALFMLPAGWLWIVAGFAAFRLFDVCKPWPVSWADRRIKGGFGAMLDDVLAGLYALLLLQALAWWLVAV